MWIYVIIAIIIIAILVPIIFLLIKRMKKKLYASYTTEGTVINLKSKGLQHPTIITVKYVVDSVDYELKESVKLKNEFIKIGFIPIGHKLKPVINTRIGSRLTVAYDPNSPDNAYLIDNKGVINSG